MNANLKLSTEPVKGNYHIYTVEGVRGKVWVSKGMVDGQPTELFDDLKFVAPGATKEAKAKMTPEEKEAAKAAKKAARAAETPADKAKRAEEVLAKAQARLQKLQEAAAKAEAAVPAAV